MSSPSNSEWKNMQEIVLARLHAEFDGMTRTEKQKNLLHMQDSETMDSIVLNPDDQILEVKKLTDIGKKIIVAQMQHISSLQP